MHSSLDRIPTIDYTESDILFEHFLTFGFIYIYLKLDCKQMAG